MKTCPKCSVEKPEDEFHWRNKSAGTRKSSCKQCTKIADAQAYSEGRRSGSRVDQVIAIKRRNQAYVESVLRSGCVDCCNTDIRVLEFDHLRDKVSNIAQLMSGSLEKIKLEVEKCEVVCANCHRIRTYTRVNSWRCGVSS